VTSWSWVYLADFASFKPTFLPADNPADFSFFFDTGGRRRCYIAPEVKLLFLQAYSEGRPCFCTVASPFRLHKLLRIRGPGSVSEASWDVPCVRTCRLVQSIVKCERVEKSGCCREEVRHGNDPMFQNRPCCRRYSRGKNMSVTDIESRKIPCWQKGIVQPWFKHASILQSRMHLNRRFRNHLRALCSASTSPPSPLPMPTLPSSPPWISSRSAVSLLSCSSRASRSSPSRSCCSTETGCTTPLHLSTR
jgi:hypothetical protein